MFALLSCLNQINLINMNNQGKFIVIDGTDGSGKATQTELLVERLKKEGYQVEIADFPQYGTKSAGLVEEYLNGQYGTAQEVGPYRASIFYACDRYDASFKIKKWLEQGKIVIANRYVTSNLAHQGGKIADHQERNIFFNWLLKLEYDIFAIPKPGLNIILHVESRIAQQLVDYKGHRDYINGHRRDLHEADLEHLHEAEKIYLEIASNYPGYKLIECTQHGQIMSKENIHRLIWQEVIRALRYYQQSAKIAPDFKKLHEQYLEQEPIYLNGQAEPVKLYFFNHLKIERLSPTVKLPTRTHRDDAGLDLYSADYYSLLPGERTIIKTGIKIAIQPGFVGLVWDKSGLARDGIHALAGVIDAGYRGEVTVNLINLSHDIYHIAPGQKVAQLLIQKVEFPVIMEGEVDDQTDRGEGRFGSSGLY